MEATNNFESYLLEKQIDAERFRASAPEEWDRLNKDFEALGPLAFDARKKFFINNYRLQFPLGPRP